MKCDVLVVGAGAAGIFAAYRAAQLGAKVILVEKTNRIGTKILISGGGKCNVAHEGPIESVLKAFRANEARFIRPAVYRLPNNEIVRMMTDRGLRVYTRPDGRVFPVDQTAKDVVAILKSYLDEVGVRILMNAPVEEILTHEQGVENEKGIIGVRLKSVESPVPMQKAIGNRQFGAKGLLASVVSEVDDSVYHQETPERILCKHVVLATGGSSYPNSGTTGDGWPWVKALGHTVEWIHAALAPIYLELEPFDPALSGVALRDVVLKAKSDGSGSKEVGRWRNDLLFTHQGVSGPSVLGISRWVAEAMPKGAIRLECDLIPDRTQEQLQSQFLSENPKKLVKTALEEWVPTRFAEKILEDLGLNPTLAFSNLDKKSRNRLIDHLKSLPLGRVRLVCLEKGEVVAGGVSLDEVDPQTMRSKKVTGLYLCGEILDVAGPVGGYNLQAAFATGYVAGESAAKDSLKLT